MYQVKGQFNAVLYIKSDECLRNNTMIHDQANGVKIWFSKLSQSVIGCNGYIRKSKLLTPYERQIQWHIKNVTQNLTN